MSFINIFRKKESVFKGPAKNIIVNEDKKYKTLRFNEVVQTRVAKNSIFSGEYWDLFPPLCYAFEKPDILMIGLGGGAILKEITSLFENTKIDVVEINPDVIRIYKQFFEIKNSKNNSHIYKKDGFDFVKQKNSVYDLIILDAYEVDKIPNKFLTEEFILNSYKSLKKNGILSINCIDTMRKDGTENLFISTLNKFFEVYSLGSGFMTANKILICFKGKSNSSNMLQIINKNLEKNKNTRFLLNVYLNANRESLK
ncbi:MAG: fused MFS/spermidine synthase [Candidatus Micrarchaeaceae archaeon]